MDISQANADLFQNFLTKALQAKAEGKQIALIHYFVPPELCYAMDLIPIVPEVLVAALAGMNPEGLKKAQEAAERYGIPREVCVFIKGPMGLALTNTLPPIDMICSSTGVCMGSLKTHHFLSSHFKCPHFLIDVPYHWDNESIKYLVNEYQDCIKALEKATGKKLDYDKLKGIIELSERGAEYYRKIKEFRKLTPHPMHSTEGIILWAAQNFLSGTEDVVTYYQSVYNELKNRVEKGEKVVREERHRILWLFLPIFIPSFSNDILTWLEETYGAIIAMENVSYSTARIKMDPSTPLESLATKTFLNGFASWYNGPMENLIDLTLKAAKEYSVDAAICAAHWGCKQGAGTVNMLKRALRDNGIPTLILDTCVADERNYPEAQVRVRLEEFFEMLKE